MTTPALGNIVLYFPSDANPRAAIITHVNTDGTVNLSVLFDGPADSPYLAAPGPALKWFGDVPYAQDGAAGTWMERAP